jgi:hypothetical protein
VVLKSIIFWDMTPCSLLILFSVAYNLIHYTREAACSSADREIKESIKASEYGLQEVAVVTVSYVLLNCFIV